MEFIKLNHNALRQYPNQYENMFRLSYTPRLLANCAVKVYAEVGV